MNAIQCLPLVLLSSFLLSCQECYCPAKYTAERWNAIRLEMDTNTTKRILGEPVKRLPPMDTLDMIIPAIWVYHRDSVYYKSLFCKCANSKWLHFDERWRIQRIEEFPVR